MISIFRGDFINYLKSGNVFVLGTATSKKCSGILTYQGVTNAAYRGRERKVPIMVAVKAEIENIKLEAKWTTPIKKFIPVPVYELSEEEKETYDSDTTYKDVKINNKEAFIEFGENDDYILIKNSAEDEGVKRCIYGTTYGNEDKSYRTTYYYGGNIKVNNQNYCIVSEGIEFNIENNYVPTLFIVYAVETDTALSLCKHSTFDPEKSDEELEAELLDERNKKKKMKRRSFSNEY